MSPPKLSDPLADGDGLLLPPDAFVDILSKVLSKGRPVRFRAGGFSMFPLIHDGDVLTVQPPRQGDLMPGDIAVVRRPGDGRILVHRIVSAGGFGIVTRGDAAVRADGFIPHSSVLGLLASVERDGRTVRLGSPPERRLLALLSRRGWLLPIAYRLRTVRAPGGD